jgi:hypothetical protein
VHDSSGNACKCSEIEEIDDTVELDVGEKFRKLSMHELDLTKLITGFVPCCTDIVALYTDGADEGAGLHVESLSECGVPRLVGSAALVFLATS